MTLISSTNFMIHLTGGARVKLIIYIGPKKQKKTRIISHIQTSGVMFFCEKIKYFDIASYLIIRSIYLMDWKKSKTKFQVLIIFTKFQPN